jgi:hypothetical protein
MKALAISMVAGAALCSVMSVPASALPMTNLAAAASDLALGQSVQYGRHHHRYRVHTYRPYGYGGYGGPGVGFGYGPSYGYGYRPYGYGGYGGPGVGFSFGIGRGWY